jgi:hypothetical protein
MLWYVRNILSVSVLSLYFMSTQQAFWELNISIHLSSISHICTSLYKVHNPNSTRHLSHHTKWQIYMKIHVHNNSRWFTWFRLHNNKLTAAESGVYWTMHVAFHRWLFLNAGPQWCVYMYEQQHLEYIISCWWSQKISILFDFLPWTDKAWFWRRYNQC